MKGAGRISAAYSKMDENKRKMEEQKEMLRAIDEEEKNRHDLGSGSISNQDDQLSITNQRKNILEKISKNILSSHGLQIDPNLSRNFEMKMSEMRK